MAELTSAEAEQLKFLGVLDAIRGRRVLVTGASGFIGSHLCDALAGLGAEVFAFSRSSVQVPSPTHVHAQTADLRNLKEARRAVGTARADVVFHLAGVVSAEQDLDLVIPTFNNNVVGSVNLFIALAEAGCQRVVSVGSSEEPASLDAENAANSPYAAAKVAATTYARMFCKVFSMPVVIARPYMCYGPRQSTKKIIPYAITSLLAGTPPLVASGNRVCDLIYVQDLVIELLLAGFRPGMDGQTLDMGTGIATTLRDTVQLIAHLLSYTGRLSFGSRADRLFEDPQVADAAKTTHALGFSPKYSLRQGLETTIEWYRHHLRP